MSKFLIRSYLECAQTLIPRIEIATCIIDCIILMIRELLVLLINENHELQSFLDYYFSKYMYMYIIDWSTGLNRLASSIAGQQTNWLFMNGLIYEDKVCDRAIPEIPKLYNSCASSLKKQSPQSVPIFEQKCRCRCSAHIHRLLKFLSKIFIEFLILFSLSQLIWNRFD